MSAAFGPDGQPTPAALGFARKHGVEVERLERVETPKGDVPRVPQAAARQGGRRRAARRADRRPARPDVPEADALGRVARRRTGELLFGRPIRWLLFLYGGRVVPFTIGRRRGALERPLVQDVRSGAVTYGHRFLATSGRAGRADQGPELRRLPHAARRALRRPRPRASATTASRASSTRTRGASAAASAAPPATPDGLLQEVPDLVEYPASSPARSPPEFLALPEEVLTTTMIHHQHFFPVVNDAGTLMPAFLAVTNTQPDDARLIARNAERVLTARLRDARFFWDADRTDAARARLDRARHGAVPQEARQLPREGGARRARWPAGSPTEALGRPDARGARARRPAGSRRPISTTDMVRELTELQGTMGGIYAREEGLPEAVWKAIYYHYLPVGVEADAPPSREQLGRGRGRRGRPSRSPTSSTRSSGCSRPASGRPGSRDPFGLRRQAHGLAPDPRGSAGADRLDAAGRARRAGRRAAARRVRRRRRRGRRRAAARRRSCATGCATCSSSAAIASDERARRAHGAPARRAARSTRAGVLEALPRVRGVRPTSGARRRVQAREEHRARAATGRARRVDGRRPALTEPAERALLAEFDRRAAPIIAAAGRAADYRAGVRASRRASAPAVDRFFTDVFVMVDDAGAARRSAPVACMAALREPASSSSRTSRKSFLKTEYA